MAEKEGTDFACEKCGDRIVRQHWGIAEDLKAYQDMLTCVDPKCGFNKLVRCIHKNLNQEKKEEGHESKTTSGNPGDNQANP